MGLIVVSDGDDSFPDWAWWIIGGVLAFLVLCVIYLIIVGE